MRTARRFVGLSLVTLLAAGLLGTASSCTPGVVGGAAKAPGVPDGECDPKALSGVVSPLVLEWPAGARSDLEAAVHDGVVVVAYSCTGVKVLADCKVKGNYGYRAVTARTETTLIEGKDDIKASFGGAAWAVAGNLTRDAKLDLTTILVGKLSTPRASVHRSDLAGDDFCKGATHFVKRVDLGAFAMATGANVTAGFSAKAFAQGAAGGSSSKDIRTKADGEPGACKASTTADAKAPEGCAAPIRVSLAPIKDEAVSKSESLSKKGNSDGIGCPEPFQFVDGACVSQVPKGKGALCKDGDEAGCLAECKKGSDESCNRYARHLLYKGGEEKNDKEVLSKIGAVKKELDAACKADMSTACTAIGAEIFMHALQKNDKDPDVKQINLAMDYIELGCIAGEFEACGLLQMASDPEFTEKLGKNYGVVYTKAINKGCTAGNAAPCGLLAFESAKAKNATKAAELADKACLGSVAEACLLHAALYSDAKTCAKLLGAGDKTSQMFDAKALCATSAGSDAKLAKASADRACALGACVK